MDSADMPKPVRAAKAAALENAMWLDPTTVKQKRRRSPDTSLASASTSLGAGAKKACIVAKMRTSKPKAKSRKHVAAQPSQDQAQQDQARASTKVKHAQVTSRMYPVPVNTADSDSDDLANEDGEDTDGDPTGSEPEDDSTGSETEDDPTDSSEDMSSDDQDDVRNLDCDARVTRVRFKEEGTKWGMDLFNTTDTGRGHEDGSGPGGQPPYTSTEDEDSDSPELAKHVNKRAANRLAEVPQWGSENPGGGESTCTDSGTPFSSEEDGEAEIKEVQQVTTEGDAINKAINKGWPITCHYVPASAGKALISVQGQPPALRMIIRAAINRTIADLVFDTAYRPVEGLNNYFRHALWASARYLNVTAYAKRFQQDPEFGKVVGQVLTGRVSIFRGQVKRNTANKVEGYYQLLNGQPGIKQIQDLQGGSKYIYPTKGADGIDGSKPFGHPVILMLLRDHFFVNMRGGSFASRNRLRFGSSLDTLPNELEIPRPMLALIATSIYSALDDHANGVLRKTDFNADMYEDIYNKHMLFLEHIWEGSHAKYHWMMARLYSAAASNLFVSSSASVTNEAILQLDLDAMEE